ncbi:MAG: DNA polymerase III subunit delta, partial [Bdellovibrionota bacterium]
MPVLEPKAVQKELDQGWIWPVYWIHGAERMKSRELVKRIRKAVVGDAPGFGGLGEEMLDAQEVSASDILDSARTLSLGGGARFLIIKDAHALKDAEELGELLGPKARREELTSVCVFLSKDLDRRKKFSKTLAEQAAVIACEDVPELERPAWIQYLAKRRGLAVSERAALQLVTLDPWSLDIIDQELEKLSLSEGSEESLLSGSVSGGGDAFQEAFFARALRPALELVETFADRPDESLPLLGGLTWNVRQLLLAVLDHENGTRFAKPNPYAADRLRR